MFKQKSINMLILPIFMCLFILANNICQAQNPGDESGKDQLSSSKSKWAIQFGVTKNLSLESFSGSALALKKQISDRSALRVVIRVDIEAYHADLEYNYSIEPSDRLYTHFNLQYLRSSRVDRKLSIYFGLGPEFGFNYQSKGSITGEPSNQIISEYSLNYWNLTFGLQGLIGTEYFVAKPFSVYCEYGTMLEYSYAWSDEEDDDSKLSMISLLSQPIRFGISVYF